jgi:hypothetical protein
VGLKSLKSLNLTNGYPNKNKKKNNNKKNNNKVKSKPLELFELAGKKSLLKKFKNIAKLLEGGREGGRKGREGGRVENCHSNA